MVPSILSLYLGVAIFFLAALLGKAAFLPVKRKPSAPRPPPPDSTFKVHPPPFADLFTVIEACRVNVVRLVTRGRSVMVKTTTGNTHVMVCPGRGPLPPIVLVHGVCSCAHDYFPLILRLQGLCEQVIVVDLPGHGWSEVPLDREPQMSWLVDSLCDCITQLVPKTQRVLVFGNSLGGFVTLRAALTQPHLFTAAVLASPAGAPLTPQQLEGLKDFFTLRTHDRGLAFMDRVVADPEARPFLLRQIMAWACRARVASPVAHKIMTTASTSHMLSAKELAQLQVPTLLIWGKNERILPRESLTFFKKHLPASVEVRENDGFGHVPFLDDPDLVVKIVQDFAAKHVPPTATAC